MNLDPHAMATSTLHADDRMGQTPDVAPPIHVSTTFRYPSEIATDDNSTDPNAHVYSRQTAPNTTRLETVLEAVIGAPVVAYASGLAALHAAYVLLAPRQIAIGHGYHGSHGVLELYQKVSGARKLPLDCAQDDLQAGDLIHLETPVNPTGEALHIAAYAAKAHARKAYLLVDATLGPPGLQDPFQHGADIVLHSGTKYLGGHSDMLCGVLATSSAAFVQALRRERTYLGSAMGNLESWLGLRSVRTLALRVERQSFNAARLVQYLHECLVLDSDTPESKLVRQTIFSVQHASIQREGQGGWLKQQMPRGYGSVFAITMMTADYAQKLPRHCRFFSHATSLGSVESLIEWRALSDSSVDRRLIRISVGIEGWQDLQADILNALRLVTSPHDLSHSLSDSSASS